MPEDVRERLLDATEELICRDGIHSTGIDTILERADAAKMSLYKHFGSKEALVVAALERRDRSWMNRLRQAVDACAADPAEKPLVLFDAMAAICGGAEFHGCVFINAAGEFFDEDHAIRRVAAHHKRAFRDYIGELCRGAGVRDADELASQIFLLAEGTISAALVSGQRSAPSQARAAAAVLLAAQHLGAEKRTSQYRAGGGRARTV